MHISARVAVTLLLSQAVASTVAWACSCEPITSTPAKLRDEHDRVFVGTVVDGPRGSGGCGGTVSSVDPLTYTLKVTEAFEGVEVGDDVELTTARDDASCGVGFEVGSEWLIYTSTDTYMLCDPGGRAEDHAADIEALRDAE
ncbi:MAG: hypothetical protein ACK4YP_02705 [Myxococcota bacterium]